MRHLLIISAFLVLWSPSPAQAKRTPPAKVESEVIQGIKYVAPNDNGRRANVQAWDVKGGKMLWEATILNNVINPMLEEDVQWIFIKKLGVGQNEYELLVQTTDNRTYALDLNTKGVYRVNQVDFKVVTIFLACVVGVGLLVWLFRRRRSLDRHSA